MAKRKIFTACGVGIALLIVLAILGSSTPATIDQFSNNYNKEIKAALRHQEMAEGDLDFYAKRCSLNGYTKSFNGVNASFSGYEEPKLTVIFQFAQDVSAKEIFGMIDAAIAAVGDDYKKVDKSLGILNGTDYKINGGYQRNVTFNGKEYLIEWVGDSINFMIVILK